MSMTHVQTSHGIQILKQKHPIIRSLNKAGSTPELHGTRVWQSTFMLMEHLEKYPLDRNRRIMEIGCGWGLLGIFCAKQFSVDVLLTDADEQVFPYVMAHARLNQVPVGTEQARFENITDISLREHDVLLGADICFWPELATHLRRLIERALSLGVEKILLADPGRSSFLGLAKHCQRYFGARVFPWQAATRARSGGYVLVVENPA